MDLSLGPAQLLITYIIVESISTTMAGESHPGSKQTSSYVKHVPEYIYKHNVYPEPYQFYHKQYPVFAASEEYMNRTLPNKDELVCVNYEASPGGHVLGIFVCPLGFEPVTFIYCCGEKYAEYCCKPTIFKESPGIVAAKVLGIGALCILVTVVLYCTSKKFQQKGKKNQAVKPDDQGNGNYVCDTEISKVRDQEAGQGYGKTGLDAPDQRKHHDDRQSGAFGNSAHYDGHQKMSESASSFEGSNPKAYSTETCLRKIKHNVPTPSLSSSTPTVSVTTDSDRSSSRVTDTSKGVSIIEYKNQATGSVIAIPSIARYLTTPRSSCMDPAIPQSPQLPPSAKKYLDSSQDFDTETSVSITSRVTNNKGFPKDTGEIHMAQVHYNNYKSTGEIHMAQVHYNNYKSTGEIHMAQVHYNNYKSKQQRLLFVLRSHRESSQSGSSTRKSCDTGEQFDSLELPDNESVEESAHNLASKDNIEQRDNNQSLREDSCMSSNSSST